MNDSTPRDRKIGIIAGLASAMFFALMAILIAACPSSVSSQQLLLYRSLFSVAILLPFVFRELPRVLKKGSDPLWIRCCLGCLGVTLYYWNLRLTTATAATLLTDTTPLFVVFLSWLFYKDTVSAMTIIGGGLAILGIILMHFSNLPNLTVLNLIIGLVGAFATAIAFLSLREATKRFSTNTVVWTLSLILLFEAVLMGGSYRFEDIRQLNWLLVLSIAASSLLAQVLLTVSYKHLPAYLASSLGLTTCIWTLIVDILYLQIQISFIDITSFGLVLTGVFLIHRRNKIK